MKRTIGLLIAGALLAASGAAWATGGRLDKSGCHNSKKAGYHCHRSQSTSANGKATPAKEAKSSTTASR